MSKLAILQMADAGPVESTALMLRAVGYEVRLPNKALRDELRRLGKGLVLSPADLTRSMGYDPLVMPEVGPEAMQTCDLFCDVKAHQTYAALVRRWPRLENRVLWTRINGGKPEHVIKPDGEDCGDEVNPPCPVLTADLWYAEEGFGGFDNEQQPDGSWQSWRRAYAVWPPFRRFDEYYPVHGRQPVALPVCFVHNVNGWGYRDLVEPLRQLPVQVFGTSCPDGLIQHKLVPGILSRALAMVHLKSSDSPGYSIYECLAAGCPLVCTRRLIWRCKMGSLLIPGETCLVFDRETHDGLTPEDVRSCTEEVAAHLARLRDPEYNRRIGMAGRERLREVQWSESRASDVESLREFMGRHYG